MSRADFFVHPDFPRLDGLPMTPQIETYEDMLAKKIERSGFPVLIRSIYEIIDGTATKFIDKFDDYRTFLSGETFHEGRPTDGGTIRRFAEFTRLVELIEREGIDEIEVNGCYLGQCTKGAAIQLFGILNGLELRTPAQSRGQSAIEENAVMLKDGFMRGKVGIGLVLHHPSFDTSGLYRELSNPSTNPLSIEAQLFRPGTLVCDMGDIGFYS